MKRYLPLLIPALFAAWFLSDLVPPTDREFAYTRFGNLPILFKGRHQPIDSFARNSLVQIFERYSFYDRTEKRSLSATEWLAEVMFRPDAARERSVFRIDHPDLISLLRLPLKDATKGEDGQHYSFTQILAGTNVSILQEQSRLAGAKADAQRDAFDQGILRLGNALMLYNALLNTARPSGVSQLAAELVAFQQAIPRGTNALEAARARSSAENADLQNDPLVRSTARFLYQRGDRADKLPLILPPEGGADWARFPERLLELTGGSPLPVAALSWAKMGDAFEARDAGAFNAALTEYERFCIATVPADMTKTGRETFFNRMAPFYHALVIYIAAFLCAIAFWFTFSEPLRLTSSWLMMLALIIHMEGLVFRMWLEGRPPVTNLYSSAIFIGWGAVILGLVLERLWRNAIGLAVGSLLGFVTLIIAHNLALEGDTMEMLRAVLDTNFWLATHVVIVTLGYASTYVAGFLAIVYVLRGFFTSSLDPATARSLARMVYGIVCFATLFSFVGTVLGGIWADQSWGRFWGWDPKENGALIIVLWNALILHARWGGWVKERGLVNLAIAGNIVTSWSWFGVNMLGIGLHSYGFMNGAFQVLAAFVVSQLALIVIGCLPAARWRSFQGKSSTPTLPIGRKPGAATA
jgi:ABC-type transport system involved in cytochrome c biogenesis permease subunit